MSVSTIDSRDIEACYAERAEQARIAEIEGLTAAYEYAASASDEEDEDNDLTVAARGTRRSRPRAFHPCNTRLEKRKLTKTESVTLKSGKLPSTVANWALVTLSRRQKFWHRRALKNLNALRAGKINSLPTTG
jgi:hypothetical protein